jgi:hypothetical protein
LAVIKYQAVSTDCACTAGVPQPAINRGMRMIIPQAYLRTKEPNIEFKLPVNMVLVCPLGLIHSRGWEGDARWEHRRLRGQQ